MAPSCAAFLSSRRTPAPPMRWRTWMSGWHRAARHSSAPRIRPISSFSSRLLLERALGARGRILRGVTLSRSYPWRAPARSQPWRTRAHCWGAVTCAWSPRLGPRFWWSENACSPATERGVRFPAAENTVCACPFLLRTRTRPRYRTFRGREKTRDFRPAPHCWGKCDQKSIQNRTLNFRSTRETIQKRGGNKESFGLSPSGLGFTLTAGSNIRAVSDGFTIALRCPRPKGVVLNIAPWNYPISRDPGRRARGRAVTVLTVAWCHRVPLHRGPPWPSGGGGLLLADTVARPCPAQWHCTVPRPRAFAPRPAPGSHWMDWWISWQRAIAACSSLARSAAARRRPDS